MLAARCQHAPPIGIIFVLRETTQSVLIAYRLDQKRVMGPPGNGFVKGRVYLKNITVRRIPDFSINQAGMYGDQLRKFGFTGRESRFQKHRGLDYKPETVTGVVQLFRRQCRIESPALPREPFDQSFVRHVVEQTGQTRAVDCINPPELGRRQHVRERARKAISNNLTVQFLLRGIFLGDEIRVQLAAGDQEEYAMVWCVLHDIPFAEQLQRTPDRRPRYLEPARQFGLSEVSPDGQVRPTRILKDPMCQIVVKRCGLILVSVHGSLSTFAVHRPFCPVRSSVVGDHGFIP